ncbi:MAG: hypothetical protein GY909_06450 [Oligoflexia bacterium]|nr:hypothetical protein [Oligoflexia bacterium]
MDKTKFALFLILLQVNIISAPIYNTRFFLYNKLYSIYGKDSQAILQESLSKDAYLFGGPCNPYEQKKINEFSLFECNNGIHEYIAPSFTKSSNLKVYKLNSICSNLSKTSFIKDFNDGKKLYSYLFKKYYPLEELPAFNKIYEEGTSNYDISYSLCMSERWQRI